MLKARIKKGSNKSAKYSKIAGWITIIATTILLVISALIFYITGALNGVGWSNSASPVIMGFFSLAIAVGYVLGIQLIKNNHNAKIVGIILLSLYVLINFIGFAFFGIGGFNAALFIVLLCIIPAVILFFVIRSVQLE